MAAAAPLLLAAAVLIGSTPDEEEYRFAILGSVLYVRALADGVLPTWTSSLGLGIPLPLVPNFQSHPLVPLLLVLSPVTWARLFYVMHTVVGAVGMWRLGAALGLRPLVTAVCVFTLLLATPTHNYLMTDFWPSHYLVWTSAPWLLLGAWRVLESEGRALRFWSVLLGLMAGLVVANTNPGHVIVYAVIVIAVAVARWRAALRRLPWLVVAALIAGAIAAPNLLQLAREGAIFDPDLDIVKLPEPLPVSVAWDVFLRPFSGAQHSDDASGLASSSRTLFFGGPFAALSLLGVAWGWRRHLALVLGFVTSALLLFTPALPITFASRFHFRDPLTLCAVLLAAIAATRLLDRSRYAIVAVVLLAAQLVVMMAAAWPSLRPMLGPAAQRATWARGGAGEGAAADRVAALVGANDRLAYSPQVEYDVYKGAYVDDGLGLNSLAFRGVALVTGLFKGVSTDVLWPDDRLFYGHVRVPAGLSTSSEGLDVLGVRYLLAKTGEGVAPDLRVVGSVTTERDALVLHENPDVWPGAFLIPNDSNLATAAPTNGDCSNDRLFCRDLAPLARLRLPGAVTVARRGGRLDVSVPPAAEERLLVVAEMFRPEWSGTAEGRALPIVSVGQGLLAVAIPPSTTAVTLRYNAPLLTAATVTGWATTGAALVWLLVSGMRRGSGDRTARATGERRFGPGGIISAVVSTVLLVILYRSVDLRQVGGVLLAAHPLWLVLSVGLIVPITVLRAIRFYSVAPRGALPGLGEALRLTLVASALNIVVPAKAGDLVKSYFIAKRSDTPAGIALAIIVYERLCDLFGLLAWSILGWLIAGRPRIPAVPSEFWFALAALGTACAALITSRRLAALLAALPSRAIPILRIQQLVAGWPDLLRVLGPRRGVIVVFTLLLWLGHLFQIWVFTVTLDAEVPFAVCAAFAALALMAGQLPFTVAGLGARDVALVVLLSGYMNPERAAALGLLMASRNVVPPLLGMPLIGPYLSTVVAEARRWRRETGPRA